MPAPSWHAETHAPACLRMAPLVASRKRPVRRLEVIGRGISEKRGARPTALSATGASPRKEVSKQIELPMSRQHAP